MTTRNLFEAATLVESPESGAWKVRLISEGKGSSGIYPPELLQNYHTAFDGPTLSFENHPVGWDGPESRNFTQIVGQIVGETWVDVDERGKVGVYANWEPDPEHVERLKRYKKSLGLSIYIEGDGHIDEDGEFVVDSFNGNDAYKSVDVVIAAGRGGRFEESLKQIYSQRRENKPSAETSAQGKEYEMDEKVLEALNALSTKFDAFVSANTAKVEENEKPEIDVDAAVKEARTQVMASVNAVEAARADLLPSQVENLLAEAAEGKDMAPLIEQAKKVATEAIAHVTESASTGRIVEGAKTTYGVYR